MEDEEKPFVVYVTKYALTSGVFRVPAKKTHSENMVSVCTQGGRAFKELYHKPFWHLTRAEAEAHVDKLVAAKRVSLQKALANLKTGAAYMDECEDFMGRSAPTSR